MKKVLKLARAIMKTIGAILYYCITFIVPKNKKLWVFGAWKGKNFSDNSKTLYEYVTANHKEINAVWIAKRDDVYEEVKASGRPVLRYPSLKAYWTIARAKVNVQTESYEDTGRFRVGRAVAIQLFHGFGAAKSQHLYAGMSNLKKKLVKIYADDHGKSYWMVPSEYFVERCHDLFETDKEKMFVTGQPRMDVILGHTHNAFLDGYIQSNKPSKMILYMPTHRDYGRQTGYELQNEDWEKIDRFLREKDYVMFFKPHPLELDKYMESFGAYKNIVLVDRSKGMSDASEYLHYFDLLVSDYSSITADFLAIDRPVIHYIYDFATFQTKDTNLNEMNMLLCGPICKSTDEFIACMNEIFANDLSKPYRDKVKPMMFVYQDSDNCKRITEKVFDLVKIKSEKKR